jgi:hypothetical protein
MIVKQNQNAKLKEKQDEESKEKQDKKHYSPECKTLSLFDDIDEIETEKTDHTIDENKISDEITIEEITLPSNNKALIIEEITLSSNNEETTIEEITLPQNNEETIIEEITLPQNSEETTIEEITLPQNNEETIIEEIMLTQNNEETTIEEITFPSNNEETITTETEVTPNQENISDVIPEMEFELNLKTGNISNITLDDTDIKDSVVVESESIPIPEPETADEKVSRLSFDIDAIEAVEKEEEKVEKEEKEKKIELPNTSVETSNQPDNTPKHPNTENGDTEKPISIGDKYKSNRPSLNEIVSGFKPDNSIGMKMQHGNVSDLMKSIDMNLKFLFVKELFKGNGSAFTEEINHINNISKLNDTIKYVEQIKDKYKWDDKSEAYYELFKLILRKYAK